jgi:DNA-binding CsgD family transcriptional regulator/PAS domain-containing protein
MFDYDKLVGSIYDCAANPELWPATLTEIRDHVGAAYALVGYIDITPTAQGLPPIQFRRNTEWSEEWIQRLEAKVAKTLFGENILHGAIDAAWTTMSYTTEAEFLKSDLYREWVAPQNLRDTLNICYLSRKTARGVFAMPSYATRDLYSPQDCAFIERISPHVRRAIMINGLIDHGKMEVALYRHILDTLSTAVFVIGLGRRVAFANASAEALLSDGNYLTQANGTLQARRVAGDVSALDDAIDRASQGDSAIGITGIGVPLIGNDGERAAAYVLPISGKDLRGTMGQGHCAVFVARRGEQQPMAIEILRTLFDLTVSEARIACLIAKGDGPQAIAEALGVSVNTVRSHLQSAYAKTSAPDQTALGALVNGLMPPVSGAA